MLASRTAAYAPDKLKFEEITPAPMLYIVLLEVIRKYNTIYVPRSARQVPALFRSGITSQ